MAVDASGNVYVTGTKYVAGNNLDIVTIKYNSSGVKKWEIFYDGTGIGEDRVTGIAVSTSGDVFLTGYGTDQNFTHEYVTIKYSQQAASTTITINAVAGSQVLEVAGTSGFSIGDNIVINPGGATEETNTITGFGSMLLQTPLQHDHNAGEVVLLLISTSVEDNDDVLMRDYSLYQNYPNPFNPSTSIKYQVSSLSQVSLKVYDLLGREIAELVNEEKAAGTYEVTFSAKGGSASGGDAYSLSSGVYYYQMKTENYLETKKMLLIR